MSDEKKSFSPNIHINNNSGQVINGETVHAPFSQTNYHNTSTHDIKIQLKSALDRLEDQSVQETALTEEEKTELKRLIQLSREELEQDQTDYSFVRKLNEFFGRGTHLIALGQLVTPWIQELLKSL